MKIIRAIKIFLEEVGFMDKVRNIEEEHVQIFFGVVATFSWVLHTWEWVSTKQNNQTTDDIVARFFITDIAGSIVVFVLTVLVVYVFIKIYRYLLKIAKHIREAISRTRERIRTDEDRLREQAENVEFL